MKSRYQLSILLLIGLINVLLHLLPGFQFEYHRDELLYFSLCNHLDFGYATTPPFMGLVAFLAKSLFGYSVFAARFFPAITSGILVVLTAWMAKEMNGGFRSQLISAIGITGSIFLVMIYGVFTPYCFDILFWTLTIYFLIKYIKAKSNRYLIFLGIVIGVAFLNKYSILFLVVPILAVLPFTKHRILFKNKFLYLGLLVSLLIAAPNIGWQVVHHFPVVNHLKELNDTQFANVNRGEFMLGQLMLLLPFTFIVLPGFIYFIRKKEFGDFRFLAAVSLIIFMLFLFMRGKSFYTSGLYPFLIVTGALFIEKVATSKLVYSSILVVLTGLSAMLIPLGIPVFNPENMIAYYDRFARVSGVDLLRKDEDGNYRKLPQVNADMLGWKEIAESTNLAWSKVKDKNKCFIFCTNYGQAGAVSVIGKKYGLPEPVSFSDAFRYWIPLKFENDIDEVVYVVGKDAMDSRNFIDTKAFFCEMVEVDKVDNQLAIEHDTKIYLFKRPKADFNGFWKSQINGYLNVLK